jgi:hypothetical protein
MTRAVVIVVANEEAICDFIFSGCDCEGFPNKMIRIELSLCAVVSC